MREPPAGRSRIGPACAAFLALVAVLGGVATAAPALVVRGDALWRENPACPPGWEQPEFDDSAWQRISFPWLFLWPQDWAPDPQARPFWGTRIVHDNCLRREFVLDVAPASAAIAHVWADDDHEFYVNGVFVGASRDHAATLPGESYDVRAQLRPGRNVVALRVLDVGGAMGALFSLEVPGAEAEPASVATAWNRWRPWVGLGTVAIALCIWVWLAARLRRRAARYTLQSSSEAIAGAALAAAIGCQVLLTTLPLYSGLREMPVLDWNLASLALLAIAFMVVIVAGDQATRLPAADTHVRHEGLWLALIVLLGLCFRVAYLDTVPVGFFQDEATNGNDARSLGNVSEWLLWSDSVGGRPTLFLYLLYGVFRIFGVSYLTLKIAPVAVGTATIVAVWGFGRVAFGARVALWAAFLLAVMRWHVHFSRMAWEAICLPLFSAAGFALLLYGLRRERLANVAIVAGAAVLSLGLYTYAAYRAVPAVALAFLAAAILGGHAKVVWRRLPGLLVGGALATAIAWPLLQFARAQPALYWARYTEVSLTSYMAYFGTPLPWVDQIGRSALSLNHIGDEIVRHNLPWAPHLDPLTGVLFLLGLGVAVGRWRQLGARFVLVWMAVFLVLASLTRDGPHATRLLGLAPACALLGAMAIEALGHGLLARLGRRRVQIGGFLLAAAIAVTNGWQYFVIAANHPAADAEFNATGRAVCEYLRRQDGVAVYFSEDVGFWADGQCFFLARGQYEQPLPAGIDDVMEGNALRQTEQETVVVLGREFFDRHAGRAGSTEPGGSRVDLPGEPLEVFDRQGQLLFRLYHFGGEKGRGRSR